jgi:hypothetical protein
LVARDSTSRDAAGESRLAAKAGRRGALGSLMCVMTCLVCAADGCSTGPRAASDAPPDSGAPAPERAAEPTPSDAVDASAPEPEARTPPASVDAKPRTGAKREEDVVERDPLAPRDPHGPDAPAQPVQGPLPWVSPPELLGTLAGPGSQVGPEGVHMYGTDMGLSFEHDGRLYMLFGDTWPSSDFICGDSRPQNDDTLATLPLEYPGGVPTLQFVTKPDAPAELSNIKVYRDGQSLSLGYGQAPMAGFSDGERSYALFVRLEPLRCDADFAHGAQACPEQDGFVCSDKLGTCEPAYLTFAVVCDASRGEGCLPGQTCEAAKLCVDPSSSQYGDGHPDGQAVAVAQPVEIAVARPDTPEIYDSVLAWPTSKFSQTALRTVAAFSGKQLGNDYSPGEQTLLVWGRPGFTAEHGRQGQLYLMAHHLPLELDSAGKLRFEPRYFAGLDPDGEPRWSARARSPWTASPAAIRKRTCCCKAR